MLLGYQLPLARPVDSVDSGVPSAPWVPTCCFATNENVLAEIKMFLPMKFHFCWFDPQFVGKIHFFFVRSDLIVSGSTPHFLQTSLSNPRITSCRRSIPPFSSSFRRQDWGQRGNPGGTLVRFMYISHESTGGSPSTNPKHPKII